MRSRSHVYYVPEVTYSYDVGGQRYEGHRLTFEQPNDASRSDLEHRLAAFPVGESVSVRYDPAAPAQATLVVGDDVDGIGLMILSPFMLFCALLWYSVGRAPAERAAA
jgi:hypothetical protein